jgi:hypothetical protein
MHDAAEKGDADLIAEALIGGGKVKDEDERPSRTH